MTFSSPPGRGLGAVKSTSWKNILKTRCWSTDVTDGKPLVTVPVTRALRELLRKVVTSWRAKQSQERPEGLTLGLCIVYLYLWSEIVKKTDISRARIRSWAFAWEQHQPPDPRLISESYFFYSSAAPLPQVGSLLGWSQWLQYSGLQNSMHCTVHRFAKSRTQLSNFHFHFHTSTPQKRKKNEKSMGKKENRHFRQNK